MITTRFSFFIFLCRRYFVSRGYTSYCGDCGEVMEDEDLFFLDTGGDRSLAGEKGAVTQEEQQLTRDLFGTAVLSHLIFFFRSLVVAFFDLHHVLLCLFLLGTLVSNEQGHDDDEFGVLDDRSGKRARSPSNNVPAVWHDDDDEEVEAAKAKVPATEMEKRLRQEFEERNGARPSWASASQENASAGAGLFGSTANVLRSVGDRAVVLDPKVA